ncbi:MAG: YHS domain-containing (seleno)protein [Phycisphaerae bacterium]
MEAHSKKTAFCLSLFTVLLATAGAASVKAVGQDGPALGGHCPVSYFDGSPPVPGKAEHASSFMGKTYHHSSAEAKAKFDASPTSYVPQLGGLCTTALGGSYGNRFWGAPTVYRIVDGKLYLFSSERALRAFERKPPQYIAQGEQVFLALNGFCPVTLQEESTAVMGQASLHAGFGAWGYRFKDAAAQEKFVKDPARYAPQFGGFCADAVMRGKAHKGYYKSFAVINNKTYLFWDDGTKEKFLSNKDANVAAAAANWKTLEAEHGVRDVSDRNKKSGGHRH